MLSHSLSIWIRWLHVVSMAFLLGGAAFLWAFSARPKELSNDETSSLLRQMAQTYEWIAWLANGALALTGVGNLAVFGVYLPGWNTAWGSILFAKLLVFLGYLLFSLVRTLLVIRLATGVQARPHLRLIKGFYASTFLMVVLVLFLAVRLAHG